MIPKYSRLDFENFLDKNPNMKYRMIFFPNFGNILQKIEYLHH